MLPTFPTFLQTLRDNPLANLILDTKAPQVDLIRCFTWRICLLLSIPRIVH
jgi:hypothetical protein